jgi:hypothetical protein
MTLPTPRAPPGARIVSEGKPARDSRVVEQFKDSRRRGGANNGRKALSCDVCAWVPPAGLFRLARGIGTPSFHAVEAMLNAHHVIPVACGGKDEEKNLVLLCPNHHAIAHRIGRIRRHKGRWIWNGATAPARLLAELHCVEREPTAWERYAKSKKAGDLEAEIPELGTQDVERRRARLCIAGRGLTSTEQRQSTWLGKRLLELEERLRLARTVDVFAAIATDLDEIAAEIRGAVKEESA